MNIDTEDEIFLSIFNSTC